MSFLNSGLLSALLPLLALPLIIHLLNRQFPKLFRFSSIKQIKETMARRSKLHRWRHLILLALRTAFLLLLLLAFLKPVIEKFGSNAAAIGDRCVLILLDHSLSMGYRGEGPSPHERALHEATKLIDTLGADDWLNVVLLQQSPTTCFVDFSRNHGEARRFLQTLKPGLTRGDVNPANTLAARLLSKAKTRVEIYYISDFQRKNWANADFTALPASARLFFVDVAARKVNNRAILDARLNQAQILAGDTVPLDITLGNYSDQPFQDRVTVLVDRQLSFDHDAFIAPWSVGKVTVPVPAGAPGLHVCEVTLPPDALEPDNRFFLTLPVLEKEEVVIVSDEPADQQGAAYFLKTALNPYEGQRGSLLPKTIRSREVTSSRLAGVKKMFLTHVDRLNDEASAALGKFLFQGGGMIYFLDGPADAENLAALEKATGPSTIPLRLTSRRTATNIAAGAQQIVRGDFKSRYLKLFRGATRQDLALLEFYDYYQASATGAGNILLTYADESPAMAATGHGMGTLLLLNFSASELSGNLPRQRLFPAWIQDLVKAISGDELPPTSYVIGEPLHTEVWKHEMRDDEFRTPAGQAVTVKRELVGDRYAVSFAPEQLGLYTLGTPKPLYAFAVNPSPDESDLRPVDKDMLPTGLKETQQAHFVSGREDYDVVAKGQPLFQWFILGGVVVLLLESGFQLLVKRKAA